MRLNASSTASVRPATSCSARKSISSSGKSIDASTKTRSSISRVISWFTFCENSPASERIAARAAASVLLSIRSAIASAWLRSSLSLRNARSENSPGRASSAPSCRQRSTIICNATGLPWPWISTTSSPVKLCGAGKYRAMPWSMMRDCSSYIEAKCAKRGLSSILHSASPISSASGPDSLTMPMPPAPGGVAIAAIVETGAISQATGNRLHAARGQLNQMVVGLLIAPGNHPLLGNGQGIVDHPVQYQPRWETQEENGKDDG